MCNAARSEVYEHQYVPTQSTNQDSPPQHSRTRRLAPTAGLFPPAPNVSLLICNTHGKHTHLQLIMPRLFVKLKTCLFTLHTCVSGRKRRATHRNNPTLKVTVKPVSHTLSLLTLVKLSGVFNGFPPFGMPQMRSWCCSYNFKNARARSPFCSAVTFSLNRKQAMRVTVADWEVMIRVATLMTTCGRKRIVYVLTSTIEQLSELKRSWRVILQLSLQSIPRGEPAQRCTVRPDVVQTSHERGPASVVYSST